MVWTFLGIKQAMRIKPLSSLQLAQIKAHVLKSSNPHTLNTLLDSFIKSHTPRHALALYNQMLQNPNTHNHFTFNYALKACFFTDSSAKGQEIHAHLIKSAHFSHTYIQNSCIHFYVIRNDIVSAYRVFQSIVFPTVVSWTSIISGFSKCGFEDDAIGMFSLMDVDPNANTLVSVLSACGCVRPLSLGKSVHCYGLKSLNEGNVIFDNAVLHFYVKVGCLENARHLFDKMLRRDVVSWSTMVGGFVQWGFPKTAITFFDEMVKREVSPNEVTIVNVMAACASLGSLSLCRRVHSYVQERPDILINGNLGNALVHMYTKCGSIGSAVHVFRALRFKDIVSWTTMISGFAMNGLGCQALPLLGLMLVHGVAPDDVTFISLLTACSHAGLVDDGLMLFKAMVNAYNIPAHERHCACVVDLYARAGRLKEAEDFVRGVDIEPDGPVWGALVAAGCRTQGNEIMVRRLSQVLVEKGASGGTLASVSNGYASSSRWDESVEIRNMMSCLGLKKMVGCSWVDGNTAV